MRKEWISGHILKMVNITLEEKMPVMFLEFFFPAADIQMMRSTSVDQP